MNKWQIICPLVAIAITIAIAVTVLGVISGRNQQRYYIHAQTEMIGNELIAAANSPRLTEKGSTLKDLKGWLATFLASPSGVAEVLLGDEPFPRGDGAACSRLILTNAAGQRLLIRLRQELEPERFQVLGYVTTSQQNGAADRSQPLGSGPNTVSTAGGLKH